MTRIVVTIGCIVLVCLAALYMHDIVEGVPATSGQQPWDQIGFLTFPAFFLCPLHTIIILNVVKIKKPALVTSGNQLTYFSAAILIVMLLIWYLHEMAMPRDVNIRVDLVLMLPAFIAQLVLVGASDSFYEKGEK